MEDSVFHVARILSGGQMLRIAGKKIHMVFCDMDGTLLTSDKHVAPESLAVIEMLGASGVQFIPCTGRMFSGMPRELERLTQIRYLVCSMGASIYRRCGLSFELVLSGGIDAETVRELYKALSPYDIQFDVFCGGRSYSERKRLERIGEYPIASGMMKFVLEQRVPLDVSIPEFMAGHAQAERLNIYFRDTSDRCPIEDALKRFCDIGFTFHDGCGIEVINRRYTKGSALQWVCAHEGISAEETLAIGDGENDLAMFAEAGVSCAMKNGDTACREAADFVTESANDECGVARFIESYLS